jgi:hypothetical protein
MPVTMIAISTPVVKGSRRRSTVATAWTREGGAAGAVTGSVSVRELLIAVSWKWPGARNPSIGRMFAAGHRASPVGAGG